jgi:tetratricopeptide (TPR) repeat protein
MPAPPRKRVAAVPPRSVARAAPRVDVRVAVVALAIAVAALLAYANSLRNGFVWDDPIILTRQLVVFRSIGDVLTPPRDIPQFSPDYYRPLTIATYLFDRAAGGGSPFPFHLSVVLAHAATSVLVYALALQLLGGARAPQTVGAVAAGGLFALHPIHTESVAWAAGRSDVMATGFLVGALLLQPRARRSTIGSALAGLCTAAALGAKEAAVAVFPLMLLRDVLLPPRPRDGREWAREYAGPLAAGAIYLLLRRNALGEVVGSAPDALPAGQRSPLELVAAIGTYIEKLLWPVDLNAYIDHISVGPLTLALGVLPVVALAFAAWWWWSGRAAQHSATPRRGATANPQIAEAQRGVPVFALAWLLLTLVPSLAIVWKIPDAPMAERYLYLPSVGFCLLAGALVARAWTSTTPAMRRALGGALLLVGLIAAVATVRRNAVWHDDIALWSDTEQRSQVSGMAARGLGTAYQQAGRAADARAAFERALTRRNTPRGLQTIYNNLGTLAMYDADYGAARRSYEQALAAAPTAPDTLFNLGLAILQAGNRSREAATAALAYYQRAAALNPHDSDIEAALAQAFDILGDRAAADAHARRALELGASGQTADSLRAMLKR